MKRGCYEQSSFGQWCLVMTLVSLLSNVSPTAAAAGKVKTKEKEHWYKQGEEIAVKTSKLTSHKDLYPMEYYHLPFCQPEGGPRRDRLNAGERLEGSIIENLPYIVRMKEEVYCQQLCITNLGRGEQKGVNNNKVVNSIRRGYHNQWILDGLPAASKIEDYATITTRYWDGFPIGFVSPVDDKAYILNHLNLEIYYNPVGDNKYEVVRFIVEPFSIKHDFEPITNDDDADFYSSIAKIINPIPSCMDFNADQQIHTNFEMAIGKNFQPASGMVLFTYDVIWIPAAIDWNHRWDVYLSMDDAIPMEVHIFSFMFTAFIWIVTLAVLACCVVIGILRQQVQYHSLAADEQQEAATHVSGIRALCGDVFRPPQSSPLLLAIYCGTGSQLFCTVVVALLSYWIFGFTPTADMGGQFISVFLGIYMCMGIVGGYVAQKLANTFLLFPYEESNKKMLLIGSSSLFPAIIFVVFIIFDLEAIAKKSSLVTSVAQIPALLIIWAIQAAFVYYVTAHCPISKLTFPIRPQSRFRPIPDQPWYLLLPITMFIQCIVLFFVSFMEMYFALASMWMGYYDVAFNYILLLFIFVLLISATISIIFMHLSFRRENHEWWWRSFWNGSTVGFYYYIRSWFYLHNTMGISTFSASGFIFLGYMGVFCFGLGLISGTFSMMACMLFNCIMFPRILPPGYVHATGDNDDENDIDAEGHYALVESLQFSQEQGESPLTTTATTTPPPLSQSLNSSGYAPVLNPVS